MWENLTPVLSIMQVKLKLQGTNNFKGWCMTLTPRKRLSDSGRWIPFQWYYPKRIWRFALDCANRLHIWRWRVAVPGGHFCFLIMEMQKAYWCYSIYNWLPFHLFQKCARPEAETSAAALDEYIPVLTNNWNQRLVISIRKAEDGVNRYALSQYRWGGQVHFLHSLSCYKYQAINVATLQISCRTKEEEGSSMSAIASLW